MRIAEFATPATLGLVDKNGPPGKRAAQNLLGGVGEQNEMDMVFEAFAKENELKCHICNGTTVHR